MLLQLDLGTSWNWYENISWASTKPQPNPRTNARPRYAMAGGTMFHGPYNNSRVWTYSGTTFRGNDTMLEANYPGIIALVTDQYPLWSFDNGSQVWEQYDTTQSITPSYGAATEAPDQGLGFFLHGRADNGTNGQRWYDGDLTTLVSGMMVIDMVHQSTQNVSTSSLKEPQPRTGGLMEYIPNIGKNGVLVAIGGRVYDGKQPLKSADTGRLLNFDSVDVYDIASHQQKEGGIWYSQRTSGDIPPPRIDSCSIVASAPDNSTHNIYVYSGQDPINKTYYDDVYVLSLPSFTWIRLYQAASASGRYGHTCHRVGRQMLTVGGQSVRRNITGMCDWETASVGILDLPTMSWGSNFDASAQDYELDRTMVQVVGGTSQGGAPRRAPENGWASQTFEGLMNITRIHDNVKGTLQIIDLSPSQSPSPTPLPITTASSGLSKSARTGIIAGVIIFAIFLLSCLAWLIYLHRRRRSSSRASISRSIIEADENPKFELSPEGKKMFEIPGTKMYHEAPDTGLVPELDRDNGVMTVSELPATNFSEFGRWGVPFINIDTSSTSRRGSGENRVGIA